jgi:oligosaccharyltransferase complex subunit epsilon
MAPKSKAPAQVQQTSQQVTEKAKASAAKSTDAVSSLWTAYTDGTPARLKFIDAFLAFLVLSGVLQFAYCVLITNFPFNAFLAG